MPKILFFVHTCRFQIAVAKFEVSFKNNELRQQHFGFVQQDFINIFELERISYTR